MHGERRLPGYVGSRLDRVDEIRSNPDLLAKTFADPAALCVLLDGLDPVVADGALVMEPLPPGAAMDDYVLLGVDPGHRPIFARLIDRGEGGFAASGRSRAVVDMVSPDEAALYAGARSLVDWHARHRFCAACGATTRPHKGGWARQCEGCRAEHFPRVDPVVIMLAEHKGRVLVGRQHAWPAGRYSALAGFVEPGETIEEAVARELKEEAGVTVRDIRYLMSQPWPFPSALMIACLAQADDDALKLDETEIEDAIWCDAAGVRAALDGRLGAPFIAPPPMAVAWHLLDHWLAQVAPAGASA
ncbi:NAD(+) diphosphatase [Sphingobium cloacae]|uniref:NAD(+) diphosphatase n=1 Tax=Sphingobium cloacae TaxID=120107 RepID=A0A1E1F5B5_9SPHN|nr:NAD(+) diphosphatase [Sphingobium cloacae]BAV65715.1 NADH pyrophosphatase [Sphingobium cloacae]